MSAEGQYRKLATSLDHLVGELQEGASNRETERLGRAEIEDEFKLARRLHWQIARRLALENAINITG